MEHLATQTTSKVRPGPLAIFGGSLIRVSPVCDTPLQSTLSSPSPVTLLAGHLPRLRKYSPIQSSVISPLPPPYVMHSLLSLCTVVCYSPPHSSLVVITSSSTPLYPTTILSSLTLASPFSVLQHRPNTARPSHISPKRSSTTLPSSPFPRLGTATL